jgi:alpha-1,3-fucosyltransferase
MIRFVFVVCSAIYLQLNFLYLLFVIYTVEQKYFIYLYIYYIYKDISGILEYLNVEWNMLKLSATELSTGEATTCHIFNYSHRPFRVSLGGRVYPQFRPLYHNKKINFECLNASKSIKRILLWTKFKGLPFVKYELGERQPLMALGCPVTNCEITENKSKYNESDLVLFHLRNRIDYMPNYRPASQRWVHVIYESPIHCHLCATHENVFNLSLTYTQDSDYASIYWTDAGLRWEANVDEATMTTTRAAFRLANRSFVKPHFAAALISACNAISKRDAYIRELGQYVPIKVFGKCGSPCPSTDCRQYISDNFKFFLAFENSFCRDYITEKFFDTLRYNVVVVAMGLGNYDHYVPKSAYINALDYETPKSLADYLLYLSNNETAYNEYFEWKKYVVYDKTHPTQAYLCEMCIQLHLEDKIGQVKKKQLTKMSRLFGLKENCRSPWNETTKTFNLNRTEGLWHSRFMSPE